MIALVLFGVAITTISKIGDRNPLITVPIYVALVFVAEMLLAKFEIPVPFAGPVAGFILTIMGMWLVNMVKPKY